MSNKNLKVYQIQFITEIRKLYFNVKFACQVKAIWKRSNEVAQTNLCPVQNGIVNFNQTLKLSVNMYFDTTTSKFVEKKCIYSFQITTDKGEKSAGTVTLDLAQFFNKRVYEMDQAFNLDKCPVPGTKVQMKITYEEDTKEKGFDSMSCISATNPLDSSVASLDLGDFTGGKSGISQKNSENQTEKSSKSERSLSQSGIGLKKEENYDKLDESDVIQYPVKNLSSNFSSGGSKIGENIKNINTLTNKINDFVNDKSKNIKFQIQGFKRKISQLQEQVQSQRIAKQRSEKLYEEQRKKSSIISREYQDFKADSEHKLEAQSRKNQQLEAKSLQNKNLISQMEARMSASGQSQSSYIDQLKSNALATEQKLTSEIKELRENLVQEKKLRNEQASRIQELQVMAKELRLKYNTQVEKNNNMEENMRKKEEQIEETRINLEKAYENLVKSLSSIL